MIFTNREEKAEKKSFYKRSLDKNSIEEIFEFLKEKI